MPRMLLDTLDRRLIALLQADARTTTDDGQRLWTEYVRFGKSAPHLMVQSTMQL